MEFQDFNIEDLSNPRLLITTRVDGRNSQYYKDFQWLKGHATERNYFELGVRFSAFLMHQFCRQSTRLEPALMLNSRWFRIMRDEVVVLGVGFTTRPYFNLFLKHHPIPVGWRKYSGPPPLSQRRVASEVDVSQIIDLVQRVLLP